MPRPSRPQSAPEPASRRRWGCGPASSRPHAPRSRDGGARSGGSGGRSGDPGGRGGSCRGARAPGARWRATGPCRRRCGRVPSAGSDAGRRCGPRPWPGYGLVAEEHRDGPPDRRARTPASASTTWRRTGVRCPYPPPRGRSGHLLRSSDRAGVAQWASGGRYGGTSRPPGAVRRRHLHNYLRRSSRWWTPTASPMSWVGTARAHTEGAECSAGFPSCAGATARCRPSGVRRWISGGCPVPPPAGRSDPVP